MKLSRLHITPHDIRLLNAINHLRIHKESIPLVARQFGLADNLLGSAFRTGLIKNIDDAHLFNHWWDKVRHWSGAPDFSLYYQADKET